MAVPRLQYIEGDTVLHRLNPISKLLILSLICISVFLFDGWLAPLVCSLFLVLLYVVGGVGLDRLSGTVRSLSVFIVLIILANIVFSGTGTSFQGRVIEGVLRSVRIVDIIVAFGLFLMVTDPVDLSESIIQPLRPLQRIGVRTRELSLMIMMILSFIPHVFNEARRLKLAQSVRCGPPKHVWQITGRIVPLVVPLIIGTFRRADEIVLSLKARYYSLDAPVRIARSRRMSRLDMVVSITGITLFVVGIYAKFQAGS